MGAQIAAHLANAGLKVLLLDLDEATAARGLKTASRLKPDPFFTRDTQRLISLGGFDTDLKQLRECDWIIEAVIERLDVKQDLIAQVETVRNDSAIVSSNTSGIPIADIAEGRDDAFQRHWLGTHFFNPPRYLQLLEVIPTSRTDPAVIERVCSFADRTLGKGVVVAKDTPGFIANRIGIHGVMGVLPLLADGSFTIEEIDAMTGPAIGRPKSATFRTMDIAGIDILAHVARNLVDRVDSEDERAAFAVPPLVDQLVKRKWIGQKVGQGFYKWTRSEKGSQILTLDPQQMEYRERESVCLSALDAAQTIDSLPDRLRALFLGDNRVGTFLRATLGRTLLYAARIAPDIAHSIDDVDRAMRWGFGWEIGPFEIWDAIGVETVLDTCGISELPPLVKELRAGDRRFRDGLLPATESDPQILTRARNSGAIVCQNAGASLVDIGDGVVTVEFHSKMNAIGSDTVEILNAGVAEAEQHFDALVIGNDAAAFSAGANLMLVLLEAQEENWDEIDFMVRSFQSAVIGLRYANVPVVVAPAGMTLGGGCEIVLHADRVQAAAETYMGQVEVGVGLIPAGGGTKELLARAATKPPVGVANALPFVKHSFELIGLGTVSTGARDAQRLGLLRGIDGVSMNRGRLLSDAKAAAIGMARNGYQPPRSPTQIDVGGSDMRAALELGVHTAWRSGHISDHDALIGKKLAYILSGGDLPHSATVSEQHLLDLEREAFLSLCGEPKTQERIAHTLKTGKTLRN